MPTRYDDVLDQVATWSAHDENVAAVAVLGSQTRTELPADRWSDLDLMVLAHDPEALFASDDWLTALGPIACAYDEVTALTFTDWDWRVRRVLLADGRDVDLSIVPFGRLEQVLAVNHEILAKGCRVLYDAAAPRMQDQIDALLRTPTAESSPLLAAEALGNTVATLLHQAVWCAKKVRRGEIWVAVATINGQLAGHLLRLIEMHNALVGGLSSALTYEGRFLEQRTEPRILLALRRCLAPYDAAAALSAAGGVIDLAQTLAADLYAAQGRSLDTGRFDRTRRLYDAICQA